MIDEYAKKGEAAKKIKPEVAYHGRRIHNAHKLSTVTLFVGP
jgi:hypothetical protein